MLTIWLHSPKSWENGFAANYARHQRLDKKKRPLSCPSPERCGGGEGVADPAHLLWGLFSSLYPSDNQQNYLPVFHSLYKHPPQLLGTEHSFTPGIVTTCHELWLNLQDKPHPPPFSALCWPWTPSLQASRMRKSMGFEVKQPWIPIKHLVSTEHFDEHMTSHC